MSTIPKVAVVQAFLVDHKKFMKLLVDVHAALQCGDISRAKTLGVELNAVGGPHIAFEEAVLYPAIDAATQDRGFVGQLYGEHQTIVKALTELLRLDESDEQRLAEVTEAFRLGVEQAEHCGTLISRLSQMDECDQKEALDELIQLRSSKIVWTELTRKDA